MPHESGGGGESGTALARASHAGAARALTRPRAFAPSAAAPALEPSQVASVQLPTARRRTQMSFTCNKCGAPSSGLGSSSEARLSYYLCCSRTKAALCAPPRRAGVRSTRLVNPEALARGTVFVQCAFETCGVWHKVADALDWWGDEYTDLQAGAQPAPPTQP